MFRTVLLLSCPRFTRSFRKSCVANMTMKAVVIHEYGDASKLCYEDVQKPQPGQGEVLVKNHTCGINFIDVYLRQRGAADVLPKVMGVEAAGVIESTGNGVKGLKTGDKVAYTFIGAGAFAEYCKVPANRAVPIPEGISMEQATTAMIQGMTAHYLVHSVGHLKSGDMVLIHAVAGGTGSLVCQTAKNAGAFVIGTCSTEAKAAKAKAMGADEVILYSQKDFAEETMRITGGKGVNVNYDSVGKDTLMSGFKCLAPRGTMVSYGASSGTPAAVELSTLGQGSFFLTRPSLFTYIASDEDLRMRSSEVLSDIKAGKLYVSVSAVLPLSEARKAFQMLEGRGSMGKILLKP